MSLVPFSGRGKVSLAVLSVIGGVRQPGPFFEVGNQSAVKLALNEEKYKRTDWTSPVSADRFSKRKKLSGTLEMTLLEQDSLYKNVNLLLGGTKYSQTTSARPEEVFTPTTIATGDKFWLGAVDVGTVVIKDSTVSPVTLVEDTDYSLDDATGMITILDATGLTGPLKRTITPTASDYVKILSAAEYEMFFMFNGQNVFADGSPNIMCSLFRLSPSLAQSFDLITENDAEYPVKFDILADDTKAADGPYGQYGIYKAW